MSSETEVGCWTFRPVAKTSCRNGVGLDSISGSAGAGDFGRGFRIPAFFLGRGSRPTTSERLGIQNPRLDRFRQLLLANGLPLAGGPWSNRGAGPACRSQPAPYHSPSPENFFFTFLPNWPAASVKSSRNSAMGLPAALRAEGMTVSHSLRSMNSEASSNRA